MLNLSMASDRDAKMGYCVFLFVSILGSSVGFIGLGRAMLKISSSEKKYQIQGLDENIRADGRTRFEFRQLIIETGVLTQSNGSARLALQDASTDILVSVKADLGEPQRAYPNLGRTEVQVSCSPSVSSKFEGRLAEEINIELTSLIQRYEQQLNYWT